MSAPLALTGLRELTEDRTRDLLLATEFALRDPLVRRGDDADLDSEAGEHVDESVSAEETDATAQQVADSRLTDPEELGGLRLLQAARSKFLLEPGSFVVMGAIFAGSSLAELAARRLQGGLPLGDPSGIPGLR